MQYCPRRVRRAAADTTTPKTRTGRAGSLITVSRGQIQCMACIGVVEPPSTERDSRAAACFTTVSQSRGTARTACSRTRRSPAAARDGAAPRRNARSGRRGRSTPVSYAARGTARGCNAPAACRERPIRATFAAHVCHVCLISHDLAQQTERRAPTSNARARSPAQRHAPA